MATYDDGGPAFPLHGIDGPTWDGLTLLDWFAGQALCGILSARNGFLVDVGTDNAPAWAYDTAEKMLAEKRRREQEREAELAALLAEETPEP